MIAQNTHNSAGLPGFVKFFFVIALIAAAIATWMMVDVAASHATARHAAVAESVRTCMGPDQMNALQKWYNPTTGRTAFLCQMPDGKFGLQIGYENAGENKFTELTNFVKEQLKRIEQVEKYLRNRGYQPVGK